MSDIHPLAALICLCGYGLLVFTLNVVTFFIQIKRRKNITQHQYPMLWILVANALVGAVPLPVYGLKKYYYEEGDMKTFVCGAWRFSYFLCTHFSIASVLIMVIERVITISSKLKRQPLGKNKRLMSTANASFWLVFAIFDTIPFFLSNGANGECPYTITASWSLILHLVTFLVPNSTISICYTYICFRAYTQKKFMYTNSREADRRQSKFKKKSALLSLRATKQFIAIVGSYIICKLPADLYYTIEWECTRCIPENFESSRSWLTFFLKLLVMSHALAVPIIFFWKSTSFRKEVRETIGFSQRLLLKHADIPRLVCMRHAHAIDENSMLNANDKSDN